MSYTPGPWEYDGRTLFGNSPNSIATFAGFPGAGNASLIAAAPDLLEALEALLASNGNLVEGVKLIQKAETAITKAHGK